MSNDAFAALKYKQDTHLHLNHSRPGRPFHKAAMTKLQHTTGKRATAARPGYLAAARGGRRRWLRIRTHLWAQRRILVFGRCDGPVF